MTHTILLLAETNETELINLKEQIAMLLEEIGVSVKHIAEIEPKYQRIND